MLLPGLLLGIGLGALLDGIVLHQILQWHHLVSERVPPTSVEALEANTFADGVLHAVASLVTVAGVATLVRAAPSLQQPRAGRRLIGAVVFGWGAFNLLDSVNHFVLNLHHVREGSGEAAYDIGFLALSVALVVIGVVIHRSADGLERTHDS